MQAKQGKNKKKNLERESLIKIFKTANNKVSGFYLYPPKKHSYDY